MSKAETPAYQVRKVSVVAKGADVLVREYVLGPGEAIPWHRHTQVTDCCYCLEGTVRIETREPPAQHDLQPGDANTIAPPAAHRVSNPGDAPCRFLLIQGVGQYDFVKVE